MAGQATTGSAIAAFFHSLRSFQNGFAAFRILNAIQVLSLIIFFNQL